MKHRIWLFWLIFLAFISGNAKAQSVQSVNFKDNTLYPAPLLYTANDMNLKGQVREIDETLIGEKIIKHKYEFNKDGKLKKRTDSISGKFSGYVEYKDTVFYNLPGHTDVIEFKAAPQENTRSLISFKKDKPVKKAVFSNFSSVIGSALKLKDSMLFNPVNYFYDDKGLLSYISYTNRDRLNDRVVKFTYNETGQLIKREEKWEKYEKGWIGNIWTDIKKGEDIFVDEISYEKDGEFIQVNINKQFNKTGIIKIVEAYDKNGLIIKSKWDSRNEQSTYEYSFDANKNWILRREKVKDIISGKETVKYVYRKISYHQQ